MPLIDTLLQLNPDAVVIEQEGFVIIEIPDHQDPDDVDEADEA